jgi:hypothetical protein
MYDQRDRDFSVRRYGRDCGREVAHVKRKVAKTPPPSPPLSMSIARRPALQRSVSRAFNTIRGKPGNSDGGSNIKPVQRTDSGYKSASDPDDNDDDDDDDDDSNLDQLHDQGHDNEAEGDARKARRSSRGSSSGSSFRRRSKSKAASNACTLEFSNYAHVDLQRRGGRASKKYEFSYWGKSYAWRRSLAADGEHVTFRLVNKATGNEVALIRPDSLTAEAAALDDAIGGVVPPCSMYIHDSPADPVNSSNCDVADVIVTTGLVALIDDCLKRKYKTTRTVELTLPTRKTMGMEYVGPKRLLEEIFSSHRRHHLPRPTVPSLPLLSRPSPQPRSMTA